MCLLGYMYVSFLFKWLVNPAPGKNILASFLDFLQRTFLFQYDIKQLDCELSFFGYHGTAAVYVKGTVL